MDDRKVDNINNIEEKEQINKDTSNNIDNKNINKDDKEENKSQIEGNEKGVGGQIFPCIHF